MNINQLEKELNKLLKEEDSACKLFMNADKTIRELLSVHKELDSDIRRIDLTLIEMKGGHSPIDIGGPDTLEVLRGKLNVHLTQISALSRALSKDEVRLGTINKV